MNTLSPPLHKRSCREFSKFLVSNDATSGSKDFRKHDGGSFTVEFVFSRASEEAHHRGRGSITRSNVRTLFHLQRTKELFLRKLNAVFTSRSCDYGSIKACFNSAEIYFYWPHIPKPFFFLSWYIFRSGQFFDSKPFEKSGPFYNVLLPSSELN